MKVLGVGWAKTGTTSLAKALRVLGAAKLTAKWADPPSAEAVEEKDLARMLESPVWQDAVSESEAEGVAIWLTGTGDTDGVALHDGELIGFVAEEMRNGRVYSGEEIGHDDAGRRAVRVEGAGIVLTLAVLAQASPTAKIASGCLSAWSRGRAWPSTSCNTVRWTSCSK